MPLILSLTPVRGSGPRESRTLTEGSLSIGRGTGNDWVLEDPNRQLSKTHCVISVEGGRFALTDTSTNGVYMNGSSTPTQRDSQVLLTDGDRFRVGDYAVTVTEVEIAPESPPARGAAAYEPKRESGSGLGAGRVDPFAEDGDDPFGEPGTMFQHPVAKVTITRGIDPFDRAEEVRHRVPDPDDDLFRGITPVEQWVGPSQADNADAPRQAFRAPAALQPIDPGAFDFDALLGDDPIGFPGTPASPPSRPQAPAPPPPPIARATVDPFGLDEVEETIQPQAPVKPPPRAAPPPPPPPQMEAPPPPKAPPAVAQATAPGADASALLAAFLEGAGIPDVRLPNQDPAVTLREAGAVFHALVAGLREVLMSRAAIKNELRVEQTMMRSRDNNALKFSVTPEEAVAALLLPHRAGYKPALAATAEAYKDIQSHEMAVMAGVQTALVGLLKRFDPVSLEARLQPGRLDSILPSARKARIWELFCTTYKDIASEAEDDFQSVFGREFARAYDAQMRKL